MQRTRHEVEPGVFLDARRAVWFAEERALAVADLHLGYAWAQRSRGSMLPLGTPQGTETIPQLVALAAEYEACALYVLGDVVQRAVPLEPVRAELRHLCQALGAVTELRLLGGNHDRGLARLLADCQIAAAVDGVAQLGPHRLLHGDVGTWPAGATGGRTFMGHEHPAIRIGDGVASVKCPCFLIGPRLVVLPAFSPWAAGSNVRQQNFMSPLAREESFTEAIALLAGKVVPVRLE